MKKSLISCFLTCALLLTLFSGCGGSGSGSGSGSDGRPTGKRVEANVSEVKKALENAKVFDRIELGSWEQDGNAGNGAEAITWSVIFQGVGKALVLSDKVLEYGAFATPPEGTESRYYKCLYADSSLRKYLNGDFFTNAFTDAEQALILQSDVRTAYSEDYVPKETISSDRVFLLSVNEVTKYLTNRTTLIHGIPTDQLKKNTKININEISDVPGVTEAVTWWLRDPGDSIAYAAEVPGYDNKANYMGSDVTSKRGIRPAMWIVYNEADMKGYETGSVEPKADETLDRTIAGLKVGDTFTFGRVDLDPRMYNGYEDIVWRVMEETDDAFIVLTEGTVWRMPMVDGKTTNVSGLDTLNWSVSEVRSTLNGAEFLDELFTPQEKAKLMLTHLSSSGDSSFNRDGGPDTDDLLFLPDKTDLEKYYPEASDRSVGAEYWLRSTSFVVPYMCTVYDNGNYGNTTASDYSGIRLMARIRK